MSNGDADECGKWADGQAKLLRENHVGEFKKGIDALIKKSQEEDRGKPEEAKPKRTKLEYAKRERRKSSQVRISF